MKQLKVTNIKNIIPRKPRRLVNIDKDLIKDIHLLVEKIGRRWFRIIDGHHRYYKYKEMGINKIKINVRIR